MMRLTQKQETFTQNLLKGMYQRDAYIDAYHPTYSMVTIDGNASRLAHNEKVLARWEELKQIALNTTIATVDERKQILSEIMRGRFGKFITVDGVELELTEENLESAALQEIRITEFTGGKDGRAKERSTTIKLHSPIQAINELNKMERIYEALGSMVIDNRVLNIYVNSEKAKGLAERLIEGERTEP